MDDNTNGVMIIAVIMAGVVALRYLKLKARNSPMLSAQENAMIEQMAQTAQRLEQRVITLEQILDAEVPAWRAKAGNYGSGSYRQ
jgi:phage shock protein B